MAQLKVLITRKIPEAGREILKEAGFLIEIYNGDRPLSRKTFLQKIASADAVIPMLSEQIDREVIDQAANLKVIANYAVGYNNIDVDYARSKHIYVTNTPDVLTEATADLTWALMLSAAKRIPESDQYVRQGKFKGWEPLLMLGDDVSGKTLGIIGAGRIGQAVGQRAIGFNMNILYHSPSKKKSFEKKTGAQKSGFEELLKTSDFISIHCPLTEKTRHLISSKNIFKIKRGAFLINTSRGAVVEESALVMALANGHLAGAGLDVYEFEPEIHPKLFSLQNVVLLPHIGSATKETRSAMARIAANNVKAVLSGNKPLHSVYPV
ncbi:MAG: D-glycerate dehydrogenase [Calditrichaceae bacterium]|nr:D-glycerate dehydrogenase [Calditrichaceae bacterium]